MNGPTPWPIINFLIWLFVIVLCVLVGVWLISVVLDAMREDGVDAAAAFVRNWGVTG